MINGEHANFIRNSRKFLHCGECGRPFDTDDHKPRVLTCGHNVCEQCISSQRLADGASMCCMVCDTMLYRSDRKAPVSHDLLGIVVEKEQAMKRVPLKYRCGECSNLCKENDMTVCRTCSGWSEGHLTEEATDFAKRPISALLCWMCSSAVKHGTHDRMSMDIVNRIWDTPIAIEYVETQLGTAEKLLDVIRGGAIIQINQLTKCFSESLEVLKLKISSGQFPLESTTHIKKAIDVISAQIRNWNTGIQKSSEEAHLLLDYFETLVKHVGETPSKSGGNKWAPPATPPAEEDVIEEDLRLVIKRNIREIQSALPIAELKLSQTPEGERDDQTVSETATTVVSVEEPERVVAHRRPTAVPAPYFNTDEYLDRPRRTTKKNYAMDDDVEEAPKKRQRMTRKEPEPSSNGSIDLSPYNLTGTHLENDPILNSPPRRGARRGRGRRRGGFRGGRGSRGGYRHLVVSTLSTNDPDTPIGSPINTDPDVERATFEPDMDVLNDELGVSFETDTVASGETSPRGDERTTDELFQELTGIGAGAGAGVSCGGEKSSSSSAEKTPPAASSSSSSPPLPPPKPPSFQLTTQPGDFLGPPPHRRDMKSPFGDCLAKKKLRPWEEVTQEDRYGSVSDYYLKNGSNSNSTSSVQSTFINNTPPY